MSETSLYGLVLAGGASKRMGTDKAALSYLGKAQLQRAYELLQSHTAHAFVSVRPDQRREPTRAALPQIVDAENHAGLGPQILGQGIRKPPGTVAATLGDVAQALRLERLRLVAGRPAVHQLSWIRDTGLSGADLSGTSLYAALADRGVVVHRAAEVVRPGILDETTGYLLKQMAGTPVFVSERVTYGLDDTPLVVDRATILGTAMEIRTERALTGLSMQWSRQAGDRPTHP